MRVYIANGVWTRFYLVTVWVLAAEHGGWVLALVVRHLVSVEEGQGAEAGAARLEGTAVVRRPGVPVTVPVVRLEGGAVSQLTPAAVMRARVLHQDPYNITTSPSHIIITTSQLTHAEIRNIQYYFCVHLHLQLLAHLRNLNVLQLLYCYRK